MTQENLDLFGLSDFVNQIGNSKEEEIPLKVDEYINRIIERNPPVLLEKKVLEYFEKYNNIKNSTTNAIFGFIDSNNSGHMDAFFDNTQKMITVLKNGNNNFEKKSEFRKLFLRELEILLDLYPWLKEMNEKPVIGSLMSSKIEKYGLQGILPGGSENNDFTKTVSKVINAYSRDKSPVNS